MELTSILWAFMIGGSAAIIAVYYNSHYLGRLVRALIDIDAATPEDAITAEELGIKMSLPMKHALRPGTSFSETVMRTSDGRYYIAPDKLEMAKAKYRAKNISPLFAILCIVILFIVTVAMTFVFPDVIDTLSERFGEIFGEGR